MCLCFSPRFLVNDEVIQAQSWLTEHLKHLCVSCLWTSVKLLPGYAYTHTGCLGVQMLTPRPEQKTKSAIAICALGFSTTLKLISRKA